MKNAILCLLFCLFWPLLLAAQPAEPAHALPETAKKHTIRPTFNFDARYSFIDKEMVRISGLKFGLEWQKRYRAGLGLYLLSTDLEQELLLQNGATNAAVGNLRFGYFAAYGEYVLFQTEKWELSSPLQLGMGRLFYDFRDDDGQLFRTGNQTLFLLEPSITGHYKLFNWLGVGAGAGYRQVLSPNSKLAHDLNAPICYLKAKLFLGDLVRGLRSRHKPAEAKL